MPTMNMIQALNNAHRVAMERDAALEESRG